jgi:hypothetical protein
MSKRQLRIAPRVGSRIEREEDTARPEHDRIAQLAYELWQRRGCPEGSPDEDWEQAQIELQEPRQRAEA